MTMRILLVDDSTLDITLTLNVIDYWHPDHTVQTATELEDACQLLQNRQFDLIILDVKMTRFDGFEFMRWIKHEISHRLPVIVLSVWISESDKYLASKLGAVEYVQKSISFIEFKKNLEEALKRQRTA